MEPQGRRGPRSQSLTAATVPAVLLCRQWRKQALRYLQFHSHRQQKHTMFSDLFPTIRIEKQLLITATGTVPVLVLLVDVFTIFCD